MFLKRYLFDYKYSKDAFQIQLSQLYLFFLEKALVDEGYAPALLESVT